MAMFCVESEGGTSRDVYGTVPTALGYFGEEKAGAQSRSPIWQTPPLLTGTTDQATVVV